MKLGFIIPTYLGERRVALLPEHVLDFHNEIFIESGFGHTMGIGDHEYERVGCTILSRQDIFAVCDAIFCLKLLQPADFSYLREGQMLIGWTHPTGSGSQFYQTIACEKKLVVVDLDNIYPRVFCGAQVIDIPFIPKNFVWKNSFLAGIASVQHALLSYGMMPSSETKVAVLASGNVSQGSYNYLAKFGCDIRMFYRKTMIEFYDTLEVYDVIVNGIEMDQCGQHILTKEQLARLKRGCLVIDAAADAGNAIEGTHYTSLSEPMYFEDGLWFYEVNNAPSLLYRNASREISKAFSQWVYREDVQRFKDLLA